LNKIQKLSSKEILKCHIGAADFTFIKTPHLSDKASLDGARAREILTMVD